MMSVEIIAAGVLGLVVGFVAGVFWLLRYGQPM